jgi:hypothetical protein
MLIRAYHTVYTFVGTYLGSGFDPDQGADGSGEANDDALEHDPYTPQHPTYGLPRHFEPTTAQLDVIDVYHPPATIIFDTQC